MNRDINGLQLPMIGPTNGRSTQSTPKGNISFRTGLVAVLQEAKGDILEDKEIWRRMQLKGVVSEAKKARRLHKSA